MQWTKAAYIHTAIGVGVGGAIFVFTMSAFIIWKFYYSPRKQRAAALAVANNLYTYGSAPAQGAIELQRLPAAARPIGLALRARDGDMSIRVAGGGASRGFGREESGWETVASNSAYTAFAREESGWETVADWEESSMGMMPPMPRPYIR
ncbi:hypothetical protein EJ04DRAFT_565501 [Polyplosphaeria fusca]|uniref:Uncharacterized protein n=1 Tax=Polyplosphaeria fusca TaxID=682080 RepID=A0A9P4QUM7_9PLEO|nr:hypothetical protein EJ04DRAFT_565501 [Polyplosphaeria fusca]